MPTTPFPDDGPPVHSCPKVLHHRYHLPSFPVEILISTVWAGPWEPAILTSTSADSGAWERQGEQDTSPGDTVSVLQCLRKQLHKVSELSPQRRLPAISVFPAVTAVGNSGLCAFYKPEEPPWYLHRVVVVCGCAAKHAGPTSSKTRGCSKQTHFDPKKEWKC